MARLVHRPTVTWNVLERAAFFFSAGDPTFQSHRDIVFRPIALALIRLGASANAISIAGLGLAIGASSLISRPLIASGLLLISLLLDGVDGVVARITKTASVKGEILDIVCDTVGIIAMVTGLAISGYLSTACAIAFVVVALIYTLVSSTKSKILLGKYRSVGSRVVMTLYIAVCLFFVHFEPRLFADTPVVQWGVLFVLATLSINLAIDLFSIVSKRR